VYVAPGCFAHPKCQPFWLGGVSGDGQLSEGRRAGSVGDGVGEGASGNTCVDVVNTRVKRAPGALGPSIVSAEYE